MSELWNIMLLIFTLTGALCWLCMIFLFSFIWMCKRPPKEG